MFRTIEQQSGGGGPEWLSSHPNPGNRYERDPARGGDAAGRRRGRRRRPSSASIKARLASMPPAYTAEQIARAKANGQRLPGVSGGGDMTKARAQRQRSRRAAVEPVSARCSVGNFLRLQVPRTGGRRATTTASRSRRGRTIAATRGRRGFTHGVQMGVIPNESHNHQEATEELIDEPSARQSPDSAAERRLRARNHRRPHGALDHAAQRLGGDRRAPNS